MFDGLRFVVATKKHAENIEKFMFSDFGINKPITRSLAATPTDLRDFFHDLAESGYSNEKYSTIVYDNERKNKVLYSEAVAKYSKSTLLPLITITEGKQLTRRAIETAKNAGRNWVATAATASASQGVFSRLGFETLYEIPYTTFRENGVAVFHNLHDGCQSGKFMPLRGWGNERRTGNGRVGNPIRSAAAARFALGPTRITVDPAPSVRQSTFRYRFECQEVLRLWITVWLSPLCAPFLVYPCFKPKHSYLNLTGVDYCPAAIELAIASRKKTLNWISVLSAATKLLNYLMICTSH
ncbi:unnamed protein product [Cylicocyclus nassatus]|uniref:Uncharacterized protein n=1 Tax=Cylicocyclus nassatus TaxID=53992 RepID=A0AA36GIW9_CYLNA|nr:unnamed protein product [Cylicocyclus nassatus]